MLTFNPSNIITVTEAIEIIQENLPVPKVYESVLEDAFEKYLAEDITAPEPSPRYTNSAMDEVTYDITNGGKRTNMIRVQLTWRPHGGYGISNAEKQGSHMLTSRMTTVTHRKSVIPVCFSRR